MRIFYIAVKSVVTECAIFGVEWRMRPCEVYVFLCGHAATWMMQGSGCVIIQLACRLQVLSPQHIHVLMEKLRY